MADRQKVYDAIDAERAYQDGKWGGAGFDDTQTEADWQQYINEYSQGVGRGLGRNFRERSPRWSRSIARKVSEMCATCVTGVDCGSASEHMIIGVAKLIGPRWTQEKEDEFGRLKRQMKWVTVGAAFGTLALVFSSVALIILAFVK